MNIVFSPYVERDLEDLVDILIDKGYLSSLPYAIEYSPDMENR